ncbi:hypothetical protein M758_10G153800 [Ceratodon purpureus]|uniref:VQ domain-containing protein n=1 Tax=Ceratodon purpureus TaxID=3225 RepID=A0A8T0GNT5_CERPU|nr:hypothetical protein KC19_10G157800 [Ceratodon purpureus]KAG0604217.1 hypothetical protein M758_10G153800 [Ceratodon purpureus]
MAGSSSPSDKICTASMSPKVKGTEKKKRKRPSKKVPTTVLESSSTNFMNLVQKLTGSAGELAAGNASTSSLSNSRTSNSMTSNTSSPYSSPSCDYIDPRTSDSFYQQLLRSATMAASSGYDTTNNNDDDSSSHSNYTPFSNPNAHHLVAPPSLDHFHQSPSSGCYTTGVADDDELYNSYPSSSRALENEISPFSSSWREPVGSHSDYWYQQMHSEMRA